MSNAVFEPGITINDRYHLEEKIGQGGMGVVYRAHDITLARQIAIKLLSNTRLGTMGRARLLTEAQLTAKLDHPNIVTVHDAGEYQDTPYIVMQFIQGQTLAEYKPENYQEIITLAKDICRALDHAHSQDIIHRDLKPENVILTPDKQLKLMDFGLARSTASRLTAEGTMLGTVFYMSPEQALGDQVDARTDLYSLGVMLYEFCTGELPYQADNPIGIIAQHLHASVRPPQAKQEDLPPLLNDLIVQLLSKAADDRPPTAQAVLEALENPLILQADQVASTEISVLDRIRLGRMVGRAAEFDEARKLWRQASAGQGQTVLISGEPGIGKTRFTKEITTHAEVTGGITLLGKAYAESNAPYGAFAQIIRQFFGRQAAKNVQIPDAVLADLLALAPDLAYQFPDVKTNPTLEPEAQQQRLFENMVTFCRMVSQSTPLLLAVEDVHWADSGTLAMLHHLIRRTRDLPLLLLLNYREVELSEARPLQNMLSELNRERTGTRLKLGRLPVDATGQMLAAIFAEDITPEFLQGIYTETEGNPFFIEELCRTLVESGALYYADGEWHRPAMDKLEIPQGIQIVVEARLARLPKETQEMLHMAAVLGREFDYAVLLAANGQDEDALIEQIEQAESAQMIEEIQGPGDVTFQFVHALVPQAIRSSIHTLRLRRMHKKAAAAISKLLPESYEDLAHHYAHAGDEEQAYTYFVLAGERALKAYANQDAENYIRQALDLVEKDSKEQLNLLHQLGTVLIRQTQLTEAAEILQQGADMALKLNDHDQAAAFYAMKAKAGGSHQISLEIAQAGLDAVNPNTDGPGMAFLLERAGTESTFNGLLDEGQALLIGALAMAEKHAAHEVTVDVLSSAMQNLGGVEESHNNLKRAVQLAEEHGLARAAARAYNNLAVLKFFTLGDGQGGYEAVRRANQIARQAGLLNDELFFASALLSYQTTREGVNAGEAAMPRLIELRDAITDHNTGLVIFRIAQGALARFRGDLEEAITLLKENVNILRQIGDLQFLEVFLIYLAEIYLEAGVHLDEVEALCQEACAIGDRGLTYGSVWPRTTLVSLYAIQADLARARQTYAEAEQHYLQWGKRDFDRGNLLWGEVMLAAAEQKPEEFFETVESFQESCIRSGWHTTRMVANYSIARILRTIPEYREKARQFYQSALADFDRTGATGYAARVRAELAELGE